MKNNLEILGTQTIEGGKYSSIDVLGKLIVLNDVSIEDLDVLGSATFNGNVESQTVDILGNCEIKESIKAKNIEILGIANIDGNIEADSIEIIGIANVKGDLSADSFECLSGSSTFNNIYGEDISFDYRKYKNKHVKIETSNDVKRIANTIEATNITLSHIKVNKVSGKNIEILNNVEIDLLEYSGSLTLSRGAKIKKIVKF